jgi:DNA polymerase III subunit beta
MKLSCTKENLSQALAIVGGVTSKNVNLPILNNVLIRATDQKVELVATNLEQAIVVALRAKIDEAGSFTVPARTLQDYVNLLNTDKIDLELQENELLVKAGKSSTKIKGSSAEEYPIIPTMEDGEGYTLRAVDLQKGLAQVLPAVAKNDIRPELAGVFCGFCLDGSKELTMAATDSYRLAECKISVAQGGGERKLVLPSRTAQEIVHSLSIAGEEKEENVRILVNENQIMVSYGPTQITSRLVEGQYPDYTVIIPKEFKTTIELPVDRFSKEMKAAGLFTTTGVNAVTLTVRPVDGVVGITSTSTQTGEYTSEIEADVEGEENNVLLNNRYVLDGLNNISTLSVSLKLINGDSACILSPVGEGKYLYIVMPIRQ